MSLEPTASQLDRAIGASMRALEHPKAADMLRRYYDPQSRYAGATFLSLVPNPPHDLTATDLYALSTLDVRATPLAGRRLLEAGTHRDRVLNALADPSLGAEVDLLTASEATFEAAGELYLAVRDALGRRPWVTASKLCARKRPLFFPVRDSVVTQLVLGLGKSYLIDWKVYRHMLSDEALTAKLEMVACSATQASAGGVVITDPPLRVLDALLWMAAPADLRRRR